MTVSYIFIVANADEIVCTKFDQNLHFSPRKSNFCTRFRNFFPVQFEMRDSGVAGKFAEGAVRITQLINAFIPGRRNPLTNSVHLALYSLTLQSFTRTDG